MGKSKIAGTEETRNPVADCTFSDHPGIVRASKDEIANHPELRIGQTLRGQWIGSMTGALACCVDAVCESVNTSRDYDVPALHHPDVKCGNHHGEIH